MTYIDLIFWTLGLMEFTPMQTGVVSYFIVEIYKGY
jgi:hypothetical protein